MSLTYKQSRRLVVKAIGRKNLSRVHMITVAGQIVISTGSKKLLEQINSSIAQLGAWNVFTTRA